MKVKTLCTAAVAGTLLTAGTAMAGDFDVVGNDVDGYFLGANQITEFEFDGVPAGLQTWQIFLAGGNSGDALNAVFGDGDNPMSITTENGSSFFNGADFGQGHFAPSSALFPNFPELQADTFFTIGGSGDSSVAPGAPDTALADGGSNIVGNDNWAWFDGDPGTPEMIGDGILIGQFSFDSGITASLDLSAQINTAALGTAEARGLSITVPGPGALALFGVAGLAGIGRRRRA